MNNRSFQNRTLHRIALLAACGLAILPSRTFAHAFLDHADPAVGSTVNKSPAAVTLWFTQELEPAFSTIEVDDTNGKQIDKKDTHLDDQDPKQLSVSLPNLPAGTYKVSWHVVSTDTHKTHGDFKFEVQP
jgi:methionine-rich copper-binding protein CopC